MRNLSELKGDEALDVLADIIEPIASICADEEVKKVFKDGGKIATAIKIMIKNHKPEVTTLLAVLEGEDPETYEPTVFELPIKLVQLFKDKELLSVFQSAGLTGGANTSTSASENIKG